MATDGETKLLKLLADAAARWWHDSLLGPAVDDVGDQGSQLVRAYKPSVSVDAVKRFERILAEEIFNRLEHDEGVCLDVDYGPRYLMRELAELAGVKDTAFPTKTSMVISAQDGVMVAMGFGQPYVTVVAGLPPILPQDGGKVLV